MSEPSVVARNALEGIRVAISVSESADLARLGLTPKHCELVVAEIVRAVIIAGGTVVYGGRLEPEGFTRIFLEEAGRFRDKNDAVQLCIAESEFQSLSKKQLARVDQRLGSAGSMSLVASNGDIVRVADIDERRRDNVDPAEALTAMRLHVSRTSDARVVVGGKLIGFAGSEPGLIEEARLSAEAGRQLYVAGGYGGAAAALIGKMEPSLFAQWAPSDFPANADNPEVTAALDRFMASYPSAKENGLDAVERLLLAASHRPADIATIVVRGLAISHQE